MVYGGQPCRPANLLGETHVALTDVIPKFTNLDGAIVDRACSFLPHARQLKVIDQVKYWAVDACHAQGHTKSCKCHPLYQKRVSLRFNRTSSSAAEHIFNWFPGCARVLNGCTPSRHAFKVLYFCRLQNEAVDSKDADYLASFVKKGKKSSRPCSCTCRKKPASKVLKRPSSKPRAVDVQCEYEKHRMCVCLHARVKLVISKSSKHRLLKFFVFFSSQPQPRYIAQTHIYIYIYIYIYTHTHTDVHYMFTCLSMQQCRDKPKTTICKSPGPVTAHSQTLSRVFLKICGSRHLCPKPPYQYPERKPPPHANRNPRKAGEVGRAGLSQRKHAYVQKHGEA